MKTKLLSILRKSPINITDNAWNKMNQIIKQKDMNTFLFFRIKWWMQWI